MKIIHQHPSANKKEENLRHIYAACLRALRLYGQTAQEESRGR